MSEVLFYHLERRTLEEVLPGLLLRCLDRSWRVLLRAGSVERVAALDAHLWSYDEESFLPHGTAKEGAADEQPIYLTEGSDNPNRANVYFAVDGASLPDMTLFERTVCVFDGNDPTALEDARAAWRAVKQQSLAATYWRQSPSGGWERQG